MMKKVIIPEPEPEPEPTMIEVLGVPPNDFSNKFDYSLIKRKDYYYMFYDVNPKYRETDTEVQKVNFISRTKDFKTWQGSGIGSSYIRYDEIADAFFCSHLGLNNTTKAVKYHIIRINPDDFSYKIDKIMDSTMTLTSRGITHVERVGNYLMLLCYIDKTKLYSFYSSNNGDSWSSAQLANSSSLGVGGEGIPSCSNGKGMKAAVYFGTTTTTKKFFTSPTASQNSNSMANITIPIGYSKGNKLMYCDIYSKNILTLSDDGINDKQYSFPSNTLMASGVFYNDYYITTSPTNRGSSTQSEFFGKIILHNLKTSEIYLFDPEVDAVKENYGAYYSQIKVLNLFENYLYFIFSKNGSSYSIARVSINDVLDNFTQYKP